MSNPTNKRSTSQVGTDWRKTNPGYVYRPPEWVMVNGILCLEVDGGVLAELVYYKGTGK